MLPAKVSPGQTVSAAAFNAVLDAVAALRIAVGPGLRLTSGATGAVLSLVGDDPEWVRGVITTAHPPTPAFPSALSYSYTLVDAPGVVQGPTEPDIARPARGTDAKLWPASQGDPCYVLKIPDGAGGYEVHLWAPTEVLAFAACSDVIPFQRPAS